MRQQSLSRKIVVAYSLLVTLAAVFLTSGLHWQLRTVQRQEIRNRLLELLWLSTPQIDSDYLALTTTADSMKEPFYRINQERLQNIQAAVPSIAHICVLRQQPNSQLVLILDYSRAHRFSAPVGTPLQRLTPQLKAGIADLKQPIVEPDLLQNLDGVPVLYGYAPIMNQFGRISGVLVIELNASAVIQSELQAGIIAASVFCIVLLVTLVVIWWLSQSLVIYPILRLNQASQQIANGQWDQPVFSDRGDELGDLAASFNQMAMQLRESFATLEQRVRDRTYQLHLALSAAKMGNWEWDMITNRQHWSSENCGLWGLYTDSSGRVLDQAGVEISPFPTFELILKRVHPDDRDRLLQTIQQTSAQHQLYEIEHRICWDDGSIHWRYSRGAYVFNQQGQPIKLVGISMDITDRKHIEQEMQRSRDLFEATFQESADAIFLVDPVSLLIMDCNQRAVELFEADRKQDLIGIQGHTLHESPFSKTALNEAQQFVDTEGFWSQEIAYRTLNGRCFWGHLASKRIQVAEQHMNLVRVTDISERKAAEVALQISEQNFRTIFNHVTSCLFIHGVDGSLLDVNDRVLERYVLEREHALTLSLLNDYSAPDNPFHLAQAYWARAFAGEIVCFEWKAQVISSGEVFDVDITLNRITWDNQPVILANVLDISERKRGEAERKHAELEIRRHRDLLAAIFEEAPDAIILSDPVCRQILNCNQRMVELFEASSKAALIGIEGYTLRRTPWSEAELVEVRDALQNQTIIREECEYRTYKGHYFWGSVVLKPIQVAEQQLILVRIADITDRKQAEFLLQRQAEADQLLAVIAQTINHSLHFDDVLKNSLEQVRQFLQCDRIIVRHFEVDFSSALKLEAVSSPDLSLREESIQNPGFPPEWFESLRRGERVIGNNVQAEALPLWLAAFLSQMQVKAYVVVPILQADQLWGLLIAHQCDQPRVWQPLEVNLLKQLGLQIGTASQKASLYSQLENQLVQKEVLLKEVHHRVKNNLQVISAVIWLQSEVANNPIVAEALADTRNRLQAMSLTHEIFYQYKDLGQINFDDYIQRLANNLLAAYSTHPNQIKLVLHLQPIVLALETAIPCGLLLNELITNAIKHGFPDQRCGEICITLAPMMTPASVASASGEWSEAALPIHSPQAMPRYVLTIQDNGIGLPTTLNLKKLKSLGLKLVYDLALQLDGNLELERQNGTLFRLTFSSTEPPPRALNN